MLSLDAALKKLLDSFGSEPLQRNLLFYLATLPSQFGEVVEQVQRAGLLHKNDEPGWQRLGWLWSSERKANSLDCQDGTGSTSAGSSDARATSRTTPPRL